MGAALDAFTTGHLFTGMSIFWNGKTAGYFIAILLISFYVALIIKNGNYLLCGLINTIVLTIFYASGTFAAESLNLLLVIEILIFTGLGMKVIYKKFY